MIDHKKNLNSDSVQETHLQLEKSEMNDEGEYLKAAIGKMVLSLSKGFVPEAWKIKQAIEMNFLEKEQAHDRDFLEILKRYNWASESNRVSIAHWVGEFNKYASRCKKDLEVAHVKSFQNNFKKLKEALNSAHKLGHDTHEMIKKREKLYKKFKKIREKQAKAIKEQEKTILKRVENSSKPTKKPELKYSSKTPTMLSALRISKENQSHEIPFIQNVEPSPTPENGFPLDEEWMGRKKGVREFREFIEKSDPSSVLQNRVKQNNSNDNIVLGKNEVEELAGKVFSGHELDQSFGIQFSEDEDEIKLSNNTQDSEGGGHNRSNSIRNCDNSKNYSKDDQENGKTLIQGEQNEDLKVFWKNTTRELLVESKYNQIDIIASRTKTKQLLKSFDDCYYKVYDNDVSEADGIIHILFVKYAALKGKFTQLNSPNYLPTNTRADSNRQKEIGNRVIDEFLSIPYSRYKFFFHELINKPRGRKSEFHVMLADLMDKLFIRGSLRHQPLEFTLKGRRYTFSSSCITFFKQLPAGIGNWNGKANLRFYYCEGNQLSNTLCNYLKYLNTKFDCLFEKKQDHYEETERKELEGSTSRLHGRMDLASILLLFTGGILSFLSISWISWIFGISGVLTYILKIFHKAILRGRIQKLLGESWQPLNLSNSTQKSLAKRIIEEFPLMKRLCASEYKITEISSISENSPAKNNEKGESTASPQKTVLTDTNNQKSSPSCSPIETKILNLTEIEEFKDRNMKYFMSN